MRAEIYYWDANPSSDLGGSGSWDGTANFWRAGSPSVSPTFWPSTGGDNDAYLHGAQGILTLGSNIRVNDISVAIPSGLTNFISGNDKILSLVGSEVSQIDVAVATTGLAIRTQLAGSAGFIKTGLGKLSIDNFSNNLTGPILIEAGTLNVGSSVNNSSTAALRSTPVHLAAGTTLAIDGTGSSMRIGTLTGSGTVIAASKTLYVANFGAATYSPAPSVSTYFATGPVFSGTMDATALNISGAGGTQVVLPGGSAFTMMTLNGDLSDVRAGIAINSGAGLTLTGTGTGRGVTNATAVTLRGGALVMDNLSGNATGGRRVPIAAAINFAGGNLTLVANATFGTFTDLGTVRVASGAATVSLVQPEATGASLSLAVERASTLRSTLDFRGEGGTLGTSGSNPKILASGLTLGDQEPWMTVNGSTYATRDSANGIKAAALTSLPAVPAGGGNTATYYDLTGSAQLGSQTFSARGVRILPSADGAALALGGSGNLATGGILLAGSRDFAITSSSTGGLTHTGPRYIGVAEPGTTLTIAAAFRSPGMDIVKYGRGVLELTADHSGTLNSGVTNFVVNAGTLRVSLGANGSLPSNGATAVILRGGIVEIANGGNGTGANADFQFALGAGAGRVNWSGTAISTDEGSGGFAAIGQPASVNIGGQAVPSNLQWDSSYFVRNGHALQLNSETANQRITLLNGIALDDGGANRDYFARDFRIADNPLSQTDSARISGIISGSSSADLLKTGAGTLELTGTNTFTGNTIVQQGVLQLGASDGAGAGAVGALSGTRKIIVNSSITESNGLLTANQRGTLLLGGDAMVTDRIGDQTQLVLEGGVFDANGRSETLGTLTLLQVGSILDLGDLADGLSAQVLRFAASNELAWSGHLEIWNWSGSYDGGGLDQLYFGLGIGDLRLDQISSISFYSDGGETFLGTGKHLSSGELVPVPEPSSLFYATAFTLLLGGMSRWRFRSR